MNLAGAYNGLRVLDLGQGVAAPYCAMLLAMHGAEVVKVEPVAGDWSRGLGTPMATTPRCRRTTTAASAAWRSI